MRLKPLSGLALVLLTACTAAVIEEDAGTTGEILSSSGADPGSTSTSLSTTSGASASSSGLQSTGSDSSSTDAESGDTTSGGSLDTSSGGGSSESTTGAPLPEGCEDHLALEVSALSVQTEGPTWETGESVTVLFSLFNAGEPDNNYPSIYVEADADGVVTAQPIFSWFAIFSGDTHQGSLVFTSPDTIAPGTEVEFTAHVATLNDACPGIGTRTTTAMVQ